MTDYYLPETVRGHRIYCLKLACPNAKPSNKLILTFLITLITEKLNKIASQKDFFHSI